MAPFLETFQTLSVLILMIDLLYRISRAERDRLNKGFQEGRGQALQAEYMASQKDINERLKKATQVNERTQHDPPVHDYDEDKDHGDYKLPL